MNKTCVNLSEYSYFRTFNIYFKYNFLISYFYSFLGELFIVSVRRFEPSWDVEAVLVERRFWRQRPQRGRGLRPRCSDLRRTIKKIGGQKFIRYQHITFVKRLQVILNGIDTCKCLTSFQLMLDIIVEIYKMFQGSGQAQVQANFRYCPAASKSDAYFKSGQKRIKKNHHVSLV